MGLLNPCAVDRAFKSLVNSVWREREYFTIMLTLTGERRKRTVSAQFPMLNTEPLLSSAPSSPAWRNSHTTSHKNTLILPFFFSPPRSPSSRFCLLKRPLHGFKEKGDQLQGDLKKPGTKQAPALTLLQLQSPRLSSFKRKGGKKRKTEDRKRVVVHSAELNRYCCSTTDNTAVLVGVTVYRQTLAKC